MEDRASNQDPVFAAEQDHLSETYCTLEALGRSALRAMEQAAMDAAADKESMAEELATNYATWDDALETHADFMAMNAIIEGYNLSQTVQAEKLRAVELLLKEPYFAKIVLEFKPGQPAKELYIGTAGISDENYRRLVVDWRSPVAEVYYNQAMGPTSYEADGRTIDVDLKLRRQFDIEGDRLLSYFDSDVAIQDALLLKSLTRGRSAQMEAITATIQKEQNTVVRHEDVPVLLVAGIAGSGKTSVLMQRIAYLFYQNRGSLKPEEVFLISPNPVFGRYIDGVLPSLGESNPEIVTWATFLKPLLPEGRGVGDAAVDVAVLDGIDAALVGFEFEHRDFRDIVVDGVRLIGADAIAKLSAKFANVPAGPHRVTLIREALEGRMEGRLKSMAASERTQNEILTLSIEEQLRLFGEIYDPQTEEEERALALAYLKDRFAAAASIVACDEWIDIDAMALRLLGSAGLPSLAWVYLKMAVTGLGDPNAKYVMVDEVQDYSTGQLAVLARYFRRAHFLLLGDPNQAIEDAAPGYDAVRDLFEQRIGAVDFCRLDTSYRSTPAITDLFASLLPADQRMDISSVQREQRPPEILVCEDRSQWEAELRGAVAASFESHNLTAVIVPWKNDAKRTAEILEGLPVSVIGEGDTLPSEGVVVLPLKLAKGLEFDAVVIPDASAHAFPETDGSRRRLYTTISRATRSVTILARRALTNLLEGR